MKIVVDRDSESAVSGGKLRTLLIRAAIAIGFWLWMILSLVGVARAMETLLGHYNDWTDICTFLVWLLIAVVSVFIWTKYDEWR
jgi:hypothetical protein